MKPETSSTSNKPTPRAPGSSKLGLFDDRASQNEFCNRVWPGIERSDEQTPLVRQYQRCCNLAFLRGAPIAVQLNLDVAAAVETIRTNQDHENLLKIVTARIHANHQASDCKIEDQNIAEYLIAIAFMSALMCNIEFGNVHLSPPSPSVRHLIWQSGAVKAVMADAFPKGNILEGRGRLPRTFHARNMERFGLIQVVWTSNLLDHLRLHDPAEEGLPFTVTVFHYAQFLRANECSEIFPEGLISETLRTLALLLPGHTGGTISWFKQQQRYNKDLDMSACFCTFSDNENRTIQSFTYWRDRIAILKQVYDESEPRTIWQWWNDGRNRERWATFWVAIIVLCLTIFFGLIQCVEGALQVYKAYHPS